MRKQVILMVARNGGRMSSSYRRVHVHWRGCQSGVGGGRRHCQIAILEAQQGVHEKRGVLLSSASSS